MEEGDTLPALQPFTLNKVLYAITRKLGQQYPDARMYDDEAPQDLNPPAFFVKMLQAEQVQDLDVRHWRYHSFDIHYFSPGYKNADYHNMADQLYDIMRWIEVDGRLIKGINLNHEIVDRVLHFFVDYNRLVKEDVPDQIKMEELDIEEGIKDGREESSNSKA